MTPSAASSACSTRRRSSEASPTGSRPWPSCGVGTRRVIPIDGKTVRRSGRRQRGLAPLHLVSAWAGANHVSLGQVAVDDKSNEITAIPRLLELLDLNGALVTIDAMGCQKEIAAKIVGGGGDYILPVKDNQPHLHQDIDDSFMAAMETDFAGLEWSVARTEETNRGRQEVRECHVIARPAGLRDAGLWKGLAAICMLMSRRVVDGVESVEFRYFIGSFAGTAEEYLGAIRAHWGIENSLHWVLDVVFREDESRHHAGNSCENLALLRKLAIGLLKQEKHAMPASRPSGSAVAGMMPIWPKCLLQTKLMMRRPWGNWSSWRSTATSSPSPTTARPRRRRSCSWPTTDATRRT